MLNDLKIKQLKPREKLYRVADQQGLCIEIRATGAKFWRYRYRFLGTPKMLTIGQYPEITLAQARQKLLEYRELLAKNIDPTAHQKQEKLKLIQLHNDSFRAIAAEMLNKKKHDKSNDWHKQKLRYLENDIYPVIGDKAVSLVNSADVLTVLDRTINRVRKQKRGTGENTAVIVRQIIGDVMRYAIVTQRAQTDPTYPLRDYIECPETEHARPMSTVEQSTILARIAGYAGSDTVKNALRVMLYTMLRTIEIRRGKWEYIDFENKTWTIPIATNADIRSGKRNMKKNRIHIVPLSDQAIDILRKQSKVTGHAEYIFAGVYNSRNMLGRSTLNAALDYMAYDITAHDFRATSSTLLNEEGFKSDWIELQLAHVSGNQTRATYNHAKYLKDRRDMLQWWADYIDGWGRK